MRGLYIHIPFCRQKCKYCDFISFTDKSELYSKYISALSQEMAEYRGEKIDTVFIGGGTPTALNSSELNMLLGECFKNFNILPEYEFTVEANPGTLDEYKIKTLLNGGVNRISVGVQSFNDEELVKIGRIHDAKTAYNTICQLSKLGFSNINLDLMTALPDQSMKSLENTINTALELPVTHISAYSLILEEGTPLEKEYSKGLITVPDEISDREMYAMTVEKLRQNGFFQYEISNFAKSGFECQHNIKYWQCREYIGIGVAAHSYMNGVRYYNTSDFFEYLSGEKRCGDKTLLTEADMISEFMIMGLRMNDGISEQEFERRFGKPIDAVYKKSLDKFADGEFLMRKNGIIRLTDRGRDVSNSVLCEFV